MTFAWCGDDYSDSSSVTITTVAGERYISKTLSSSSFVPYAPYTSSSTTYDPPRAEYYTTVMGEAAKAMAKDIDEKIVKDYYYGWKIDEPEKPHKRRKNRPVDAKPVWGEIPDFL